MSDLKESTGEQEPNLNLTSNLTTLLLTFPTMQQAPRYFCLTKTMAEYVGFCRVESPNDQRHVLKNAEVEWSWSPSWSSWGPKNKSSW